MLALLADRLYALLALLADLPPDVPRIAGKRHNFNRGDADPERLAHVAFQSPIYQDWLGK